MSDLNQARTKLVGIGAIRSFASLFLGKLVNQRLDAVNFPFEAVLIFGDFLHVCDEGFARLVKASFLRGARGQILLGILLPLRASRRAGRWKRNDTLFRAVLGV